MSKKDSGFTVIELLIVITVVICLGGLALNLRMNALVKDRDTSRISDIRDIKDKLDEYFNENNGYPNTFTTSTFVGLDSESLKDPDGNSITINTVVNDEEAANAVTAPKADSTSQYIYIPYGEPNCTNNCKGFVLKAFIEKPSPTYSNPYVKKGAGNL